MMPRGDQVRLWWDYSKLSVSITTTRLEVGRRRASWRCTCRLLRPFTEANCCRLLYPHGAHQSNLYLTHFTTRCPTMQRIESISSHWSNTTWVGATIPLNHLATPVWVILRRLQVLDLLRKLRNASPGQTASMICELRPFR